MRIVFIGAHVEALRPLRHLLERDAGVVGLVTLTAERLQRMSGGADLASAATDAGVPVYATASANDEATVAWVRSHEPDIVLTVGWTQLLHEALLAVPSIACLGFHASLLPRYRGRAPVNWALINDERETGNTLMVLSPGADEGDIVAQRRIPITDADDCATLYEKVADTEIDMLDEVLPLAAAGRLPRRPQSDTEATVMPRRRPEDGEISWAQTARQVFNLVRAVTHPYPGAFTAVDGDRLFVWRSEEVDGAGSGHDAGLVHVDDDGWPVVTCGDGRGVRLVRVQRQAGTEVDGRDLASSLACRRLG